MHIYLKLTILATVSSNFLLADTVANIMSKSTIKIYVDSSETERLGYNNCDSYINGENLIIKNFIKTGDTIFDAGAHIGEWSHLVLEHTSNHCNLYSFEPIPYFFNKLIQAVGQKANCFNLGLSKTEAELVINHYYIQAEGCSSLYDRKTLGNIPVKKINISVISLDKFCKDHAIKHIDFLKIDTEGAEWDILHGANRLISDKNIDFIQFEYGGTYSDANTTLAQVYAYLTNKNYTIFRITSDGLICIPKWHKELESFQYANYLACASKNFISHTSK